MRCVRRPDRVRRRTSTPTARACRTARAGRTRRRTSSQRSCVRRVASAASARPRPSCAARGSPPRRGTSRGCRRRRDRATVGDPERRGGTSRRPRPVTPARRARRVGARAPRVALVAAHVVPRTEVAVVVLAAGLEQVRVVGDEHRRHARRAAACAVIGSSHSSIEPHGRHRKSSAPHEQVVAGRHARQRPGDVVGEPRRPRRRTGRGSAWRTRCRRSARACAGSASRAGRRRRAAGSPSSRP